MRLKGLPEHIFALRTSVIGLRNPIPPAVIEHFNRLLRQARWRSEGHSLVHEIPFARKDILRGELLVWIAQLEVAVGNG